MKKAFAVLYLLLICLFGSACGANLVVNSSGDQPDSNIGDGVCKTSNNDCTLRAAIMEANVENDVSKITFYNVTNIAPASALPHLTASNTHIDGDGLVTLNGEPNINQSEHGLVIDNSSYNIIQGLKIRYFKYGIYILGDNGTARLNKIGVLESNLGDATARNVLIYNITGIFIAGQGASENVIAGNYIGTDAGGGEARPNVWDGIQISSGAHHNLIGSTSGSGIIQGGNLISGNSGHGIKLYDVSHNHISGNFIGTSITGNVALGNSGDGVRIMKGSHDNYIGIAPTGEGSLNLLSGNTSEGVWIETDSDYNIISGNFIGTDLNGTGAMPNRYGIWIGGGSSANIIGTNGDGTADLIEGNLISGNHYGGVRITDSNSIHNVIAGNYIGTNFDTSGQLGNGGAGITISGDLNLIGTNGDGVSDTFETNVISGNYTVGIQLNAFSAHVRGNYIGTDSTGTIPLGNVYDGIMINTMSSGNLIGTNGDGVADAFERNIISGNGIGLGGSAGIEINGDDNIVAGNYIGTDVTGNSGLGNLQDGIQLSNSASGNLIGTDGDGVSDSIEGNLISGNGRVGIWLLGAYANTVAGNLIGTNISGTAAIPNMHAVNEGLGAVYISAGANSNIIGTNSDGNNDAAEGNLISGNARRGIAIRGLTTHANVVAGNKIGTDITGTLVLGNQLGIDISQDAWLNQIGTDGDGNSDSAESNIISGNSGPGIFIRGSHNQIAGNYIGTDISGTVDLGNGTYGISIQDTSDQNKIGGSVQKANWIAFNTKDGILINGIDADRNTISFNSIYSNDESGIDLIENGEGLWFSPNDPGDIDNGANDVMNFPVLNSASSLSPMLTITGDILDGLPNTTFDIQFFANDVCDSPSGYGEGKTYIGSTTQVTDGSGNVSFLSSMASGVSAGQFITATATANENTSEFSACVEVADASTYSLPLKEDPCEQFEMEEMKLVTFGVDPEQMVFNLYVKNPFEYPGQSPDEPEEWVYSAFLGDVEANNCNFQGFPDRVYCNFIIPEDFLETTQELRLMSNKCIPVIYLNEKVSIFRKEPEVPACSSDLAQRDCIAAGGEYSDTTNCCTLP